MKDMNLVRLTGSIFWSKLDDKQTYSILRLGVKLGDGTTVFCTVNNPSVKNYELIKTGNKVVISGGQIDTWEKQDGTSELQIKVNDSGIQFFPKEKSLGDVNQVNIVGKIATYTDQIALIEMVGERNPKTDKPTIRKAKLKVPETFSDSVNSKVMLEGKLASVEVDGKSKMTINIDYDKINLL